MVPMYFPRGAAIAFAAVSSLGSLGSLASPALVGWIATVTGSVVNGTLYLGSVMVLAAACLIVSTRGKQTSVRKIRRLRASGRGSRLSQQARVQKPRAGGTKISRGNLE